MMIMTDLLEDADPEKRSEFVHNIKYSLGKMEWLVGALLKMAKIDVSKIEGYAEMTPEEVSKYGCNKVTAEEISDNNLSALFFVSRALFYFASGEVNSKNVQ